ncbi:hypothetical protein Tco_0236718 [Tanacetum coccineum]
MRSYVRKGTYVVGGGGVTAEADDFDLDAVLTFIDGNGPRPDVVVVPTVIEALAIPLTAVVDLVDLVADVEVMLGIGEEKMGSYTDAA